MCKHPDPHWIFYASSSTLSGVKAWCEVCGSVLIGYLGDEAWRAPKCQSENHGKNGDKTNADTV